MGYEISDAGDNDLGQGYNIHGWAAMRGIFEKAGGKKHFPAFDDFVEDGWTNQLTALSAECKVLAKKTTDKSLRECFTRLSRQAGKADEIIILTM